VEIVNLRSRATGITDKPGIEKIARAAKGGKVRTKGSLRCVFGGKMETPRLIAREELRADDRFSGPAVVTEYSATTLVPAGWEGRVDSYGQIFLQQTGKTGRDARNA
jgi:N-methylhydantoinase A